MMSKVSIKMTILFGLLLGVIRIAIYYFVTLFKFDLGYIVDVFFVIYIPVCLLMIKPKKIYFLLNLIATSILVGTISIIIYQLFLTVKGHPIYNQEYLLSRAIAALTVLVLSFFGAILFYLIQAIFKNKWGNLSIDIETIGQ